MTILLCLARQHGLGRPYARTENRCNCYDAVIERRRVARLAARRRYIRGRHTNFGAPRDRIVDPIAVDLAAGGDRSVRLTPAERAAAIARLDSYGMSAADVAHRLGVTVRTVQRWRAARRRTTQPQEA